MNLFLWWEIDSVNVVTSGLCSVEKEKGDMNQRLFLKVTNNIYKTSLKKATFSLKTESEPKV